MGFLGYISHRLVLLRDMPYIINHRRLRRCEGSKYLVVVILCLSDGFAITSVSQVN